MNNTVIEVLDAEHGRKVIEWWKSQGVDTGDCQGTGRIWRYYGVIDGHFNSYSLSEVSNPKIKVISLPEKPNNYYQQIPRSVLGELYNNALPKSEMKKLSRELASKDMFSDLIKLKQTEVNNLFACATAYDRVTLRKYLTQVEDNSVDLNLLSTTEVLEATNDMIDIRTSGEYAWASFWLDDSFDWNIVEDSVGQKCLVPTKKSK
jgi:hypothetical protein